MTTEAIGPSQTGIIQTRAGEVTRYKSGRPNVVMEIETKDGTLVRFILGTNGVAEVRCGRNPYTVTLNEFTSVAEAFPD